jgi:hypothetical protein
MKSEMHESESSLAPVDYEPYLKLLQEVVEKFASLFTFSPLALQIQSANLALQVANEFKKREGTRKALPPLFPYSLGTRMATIHLAGEQEHSLNKFGKHIEAIRDLLLKKYSEVYEASSLTQSTLEEFFQSLMFPLARLDCEQPKKAGIPGKPDKLHYPFSAKQKLSKRRVHVHTHATRPDKSTIRYRGHKLSIKLSQTGHFDDDLIEGFCQLAQAPQFGATPAEVVEMRTSLQQGKQDPTSELARLKKLVREETLGKLKEEAGWRFWSAVLDDMEQVQRRLPATSDRERKGLEEMRRQLRMLTRFRTMLHDPQYGDTDFDVRYGKGVFNLRTIFARADAYRVLPILVEVAGTLGEVQDQAKDEQLFAYGLRFKLNGSVGAVPSVYQYYAALLDPTNDEHKERLAADTGIYHFFADEVIRIAVLYCVLFVLPDDAAFESYIRDKLIKSLAAPDGDAKTSYLQRLSRRLLRQKNGLELPDAEGPLEDARHALETYFHHASVGPIISPFVGYLVLHNGMLNLNPDRMVVQKRFFRTELFNKDEQHKEALRYISVQDALPQQNEAFYALPIQIHFEPIYLSSLDKEVSEEAHLCYAIDRWQILPVIFVPDTPASHALANQAYGKYPRVLIPYRERVGLQLDSPEIAIYRWAFALISYLSLDVLWSKVIQFTVQRRERLFFPMIRMHEQTQEKGFDRGKLPTEGSVIRGLAKTLAHLYSSETGTLSNTQGFTRRALTNDSYMLGNGLSSLYNVLPRIIERPKTAPNALDKLAIIIISSRRSDLHTGSAFQRICVYGEVVFCTRQLDGKLKVEQFKTFAVNETSDDVYRTPRTLNDQVRRCDKAGYHHIFYIAKAPYTSHVHFTGKEESEELFFMSPHIIGGVLETFPDVKLYPMFCDQYYVAKVNTNPGKESLYVDDTKELREILTDPSKSTVVFFNVMNGIQVQPREKRGHRYYSGVVSYATLINMYANPLYDQPIRNNLLDNREPGSLRKDMLDFLAYVHGVRYEQRLKTGVQLKLDPYDAIIGYDSVGARAIIPSTDYRVQTNLLAFLTLVRGRLRRKSPGSGDIPSSAPSSLENTIEKQDTPEPDSGEGGVDGE